jgi:hypothetical protein
LDALNPPCGFYRKKGPISPILPRGNRLDRKVSDYGYTGQAGKMKAKKSRPERILFQLLFVQVLEKLLESVVVEGKRVHRIDIELVIEIDPTVFQVFVAAAFRGWLPFTAFVVVAAFTDQWKSSSLWRLKQFILIRHVA